MLKEDLALLDRCFTPKRAWNAVKSEVAFRLSNLLRRPVVSAMPPILMIEPTNICNLRCPLCPSGNGTLRRSKGMMDIALFRRIVDQAAPDTTELILWNQGEPFLHPHLTEMIRYASQKKMWTTCSSNLNLEMDWEKVVRSGLGTLIVSLDGVTQDVYNQYRVNGNLEKVLSNTRSIVQTKRDLGVGLPVIRWQFLAMRHNEHQIQEARTMAARIGVDVFELKSAQIYQPEDADTYLPLNPAYSRYRTRDGELVLKAPLKNRCARIWSRMVINWDGRVAPCCFDKDIDYPVGDATRQKIREIWRGRDFQEFRARVLTHRADIPMCRNCGEGMRLKLFEETPGK